MNIAEVRGKCKSLVAKVPKDALILAILVLASSFSFIFGYMAGKDAEGISQTPTPKEVGAPTESVGVVASKSGTKYYLPSCAGAGRISEANKVWFVSREAATSAGYAPASNCDGI